MAGRQVRVLFSKCIGAAERKALARTVARLGGAVAPDGDEDFTHFVTVRRAAALGCAHMAPCPYGILSVARDCQRPKADTEAPALRQLAPVPGSDGRGRGFVKSKSVLIALAEGETPLLRPSAYVVCSCAWKVLRPTGEVQRSASCDASPSFNTRGSTFTTGLSEGGSNGPCAPLTVTCAVWSRAPHRDCPE